MKLEKINPCLKAGVTLAAVILLSFQYLVLLNSAVFLLSLLLLFFFSDAKKVRICKLLIPAFITAFGLFVMGLYYARGSSIDFGEIKSAATIPYAVRAAMATNFYAALQLATRLLAYAGFGILFALSTDGELFIASLMHQCRLSPKFAYGILAAIHLLPNIVRESQAVRLAYRSRGLRVHWYSAAPLFTMMVNSIRWSECIAMAMESKGFSAETQRTYFLIPKVHWYDWAYAVFWLGGIIIATKLLPFFRKELFFNLFVSLPPCGSPCKVGKAVKHSISFWIVGNTKACTHHIRKQLFSHYILLFF